MRITCFQTDIAWEDKQLNISRYRNAIQEISGKTDLVVLPEMCTTGFTMNAEALAETNSGETIQAFCRLAAECKLAIAGSFIGKTGAECFNRGFFVEPDGKTTFYDKRHLFRMGEEPNHYAAGSEQVIVSYKGWNICLSICYDLRFPVWLRNVENEYDLLLVVANWPESRQRVFDQLLIARAIENQAYVCGVNRIGTDHNGLNYAGGSTVIDAYGRCLTTDKLREKHLQTVEIDLDGLRQFRKKFPVWKDADNFNLSF